MQKILIHDKRDRDKRAKDILYIHDTIETFGGDLAAIREQWQTNVGLRCTQDGTCESNAPRKSIFAKSMTRSAKLHGLPQAGT